MLTLAPTSPLPSRGNPPREGRAAERRADERPRAHDESQPSDVGPGGADGTVVVGRDSRVEGPTEACDLEDNCGRAGGGVGEEEAQHLNLGWEYAVVRGRAMLFFLCAVVIISKSVDAGRS
jgi:hypothetical protein